MPEPVLFPPLSVNVLAGVPPSLATARVGQMSRGFARGVVLSSLLGALRYAE